MSDPDIIKIHPVIAHDKTSTEACSIPICAELACEDGQFCTRPKDAGSLRDLRDYLNTLFKTEEKNSRGMLKFELNPGENFIRTLDDLLGDYNFLPEYEKIVICCPLHYLKSESYKKEEDKLIKLIYELGGGDGLSFHPELQNFYQAYTDTLDREKLKIIIYRTVRNAAVLWFRYIKKSYYSDIPHQTRKNLLGVDTFP